MTQSEGRRVAFCESMGSSGKEGICGVGTSLRQPRGKYPRFLVFAVIGGR